jgi:hypothetical protein
MARDYTNEVNEILIAAAEKGLIIVRDFQAGRYVDVAGKSFPYDLNNYDVADGVRYVDAVDVIARRGWCRILCQDGNTVSYELTASGFDEARRLREANSSGAVSHKWTTKTGYVNRNGQLVIRDTGLPGTDRGQRVYQMACGKCGHVYGANGTDIHERRCPQCGGGAEGLKYAA